jgi:hypothetical protein
MAAHDAEAVLARWREVERELAEAAPGSREEERLQAEAAALRDEYQRVMDVAGGQGAPEGELAN